MTPASADVGPRPEVVVTGYGWDGIDRADVEAFAASLREATDSEWDPLVDEFGE